MKQNVWSSMKVSSFELKTSELSLCRYYPVCIDPIDGQISNTNRKMRHIQTSIGLKQQIYKKWEITINTNDLNKHNT